VVHRDIKPANLMLMADDTLKVTDFGTAKILQLNTTQTAHVIGTPSYMSPEQIKGKPVDGRTDVFSLGVVLYELLTGAKPFPGESVTSVIYKVVNEDPVPPRELDTAIHPGLSAIVQRALSKSPWARFQSCREFAEALQHYQDFDEPRAARSAPAVAPKSQHAPTNLSPVVSAAGLPMASPAKPVLGQTPWATLEEPPKRRGGFALIAILLLAIIGGAGYRVYPALQDIWQLRNARANGVVASSSAPSSVATPEATSADGNSADKPSADASTVPAAATVSASAATPNSAPSASANSTQESAPVTAPVNASADAPANSASATNPAPVAPATPGAVPDTSEAAPAPVATRPPVRRKAVAPQASQVAMNWKDLIEAKLESSNIQGDVHVAAAGNSVILTGRLNPFAHARLLRQLQYVPQGLQIVDDIEYSEAQATRGSQEDDASAKR
jgi:serine/threonine protein kinase